MNRYLQSREKWAGRATIDDQRTGDHSKTIGWWIYGDGGDASGPVARCRAAYLAGLEAADELRGERQQMVLSKKYTSLGLAEASGEHALVNGLPKLKRARVQVEKLKAELAERRAAFTVAKPDPKDTLGEMQRAEMRKALREMNDTERRSFVMQHRDDPAVVHAIVQAPAALSGVGDLAHSNMTTEQLGREHGDALDEVADLEEIVAAADRCVSVARDEIRSIIGCSPDVFESIAKVAETNNGELPFRIETEGDAERPKVYDFQAKRWRDAKPEEVRSSQAAA